MNNCYSLKYFCAVSVPHCKERWRNLRACLTRHLKNSKQQTANGNTNYKPYYLADHMKFVLPYTKCRSQRDTVLVTEDSTNSNMQKIEIDDYDDEKISEPETPCTASVQGNPGGNVSKKESIGRFIFVPPLNSTPNVGVKRSTALIEQESEIGTGNPSTDKKMKVSPDVFVIKEMDDADLNFFKSLLPDIRQMTPSQKRKFKMGIFELINKIMD